MRVNPVTQTFIEMSQSDYIALRQEIELLVVHGTITERIRVFFEFWRVALGYDDRQGLLLMSTAFPQRVLLSLLHHKESADSEYKMGMNDWEWWHDPR